MQTTDNSQDILRQIAAIQRMERGKLSVMRQGPEGPYYNLQRWTDGRNVTEYVPRDQVALVEQNIEAHRRFTALVGQYEAMVTEVTSRERKAGVKKKRQVRKSSSPRTPKSNP